jgi:tetratricopeptide (TPR) repeat protein
LLISLALTHTCTYCLYPLSVALSLGALYERWGRAADALSWYDKATAINPDAATAWAQKAQMLSQYVVCFPLSSLVWRVLLSFTYTHAMHHVFSGLFFFQARRCDRVHCRIPTRSCARGRW